MNIDRKELLDALATVQPGLASKEVIEQSQSFIFLDGKVLTYNDEIAISYPVALDVEGAVKAEELYKLLNKSKAKELNIEISDNELLIKTKRSKAGIKLEAEISLPLKEIGKPSGWMDLPDTFCEALKFCLFSASTDMIKPILTCLHVEGRYVQSTDRYRITRYDMGTPRSAFPEGILISATTARELIKYSPVKYAVSENGWLHFKSDSKIVFSCRTYEDTYPKTKHLLEVEGTDIRMPKKLKAMLERAAIFSKADIKLDERVKVTIRKNKLTIYAEGESGWFKERTKIKYTGDEIVFTIHPEFFKDTLDLAKRVTVGESQLKFEGELFVHVVCLMMPKE